MLFYHMITAFFFIISRKRKKRNPFTWGYGEECERDCGTLLGVIVHLKSSLCYRQAYICLAADRSSNRHISKIKITGSKCFPLFLWRRRRDSNSRTVLPVTRFPVVRPRPTRRLLHILFATCFSQSRNLF